jgi:hypothetical protein
MRVRAQPARIAHRLSFHGRTGHFLDRLRLLRYRSRKPARSLLVRGGHRSRSQAGYQLVYQNNSPMTVVSPQSRSLP